jgi:monoamine oxidase
LKLRLQRYVEEVASVQPRLRATEAISAGRVIVVGGGLAGLMAARTLANAHHVTLFEARDRVGGRVHSLIDDADKRITEAGAELIGYAHPTWLTLASEFKLGLAVWTSDSDFDKVRLETPMHLNGVRLSAQDANHIYHEMDNVLAGMIEDAQKIRDPWQPWKAPNATALDNEPLSQWIERHSRSELVRAALEVQFANTNGAPTSHQSYLANLALIAGAAQHGEPGDFFTLSENVRCARGNEALAKSLAADIEHRGSVVHRLSPVERIEVAHDKVVVCASGRESLEADYLVLAIPPSLWPGQPGSTLSIDPPLPADCRMTMGIAVKHLTRFARRFWLEKHLAPSGVSETCGMLWEGTDNQMQTPDQDVELSLFAGGIAAGAAVDAFQSDGSQGVQRFYDARIADLYPLYPTERAPDPKFVPWPIEPWTMTGYSCPAPGDVCRVGPQLLVPWQKRLFIAGEHACLPYFGYMEGALQSGQRVGQQILKL